MIPFFNQKRVLVTGAGGFIGSHLVEALVQSGASVRAFIRYNSRADCGLLRMIDPQIRADLEIIGGDLRDTHAIHHAVKDVQLVFHLGALISIPYSYHHPREVIETNVMGTLNVLNACLENGVERLIHTSTSEVYGTAQFVPINEQHPLQGQSPYSASKIGADKLAESYYCSYDLPVVTVRPFNTYGPRQSARAVIPAIITQAISGKPIRLGNTKARRDFTYVTDTVHGFLCTAEAKDVEGGVFNLGVGQEVTIEDVCEIVAAQLGQKVEIIHENERLRPEKSEVQRLLSDNKLARDRLGWSPEIQLVEGLERTIKWVKGNLGFFRVGKYEL